MNRHVFHAIASVIQAALVALYRMAGFAVAYVHARIAFAWFRWRLTHPR